MKKQRRNKIEAQIWRCPVTLTLKSMSPEASSDPVM
jgi:hypothetical protein